jgi:hypothetical protein
LFAANSQQTDVYEKPYCRIGPYLVGVGLAFLFDDGFGKKEKKEVNDNSLPQHSHYQPIYDQNNNNQHVPIYNHNGYYEARPRVCPCLFYDTPAARRCYVALAWFTSAFIMVYQHRFIQFLFCSSVLI